MDLIGLVYFWTSRFCRVRASIHALFYTTMFYETVNNYFLLCHTNKIKHQVKIYQKCVDRVRKNSLKIIQGCALAEPGGPCTKLFALGRLENLRFFIQIICWAP